MEKNEATAKNGRTSDADFIVAAKNIAEAWHERPAYALSWTSPEQLEGMVSELEALLNTGRAAKGERAYPPGSFNDLNTVINRHLVYVKGYLMTSFSKKDAQTHYARFGIVRLSNGHYGFPVDCEQRLQAMQRLIKTLETSEYRDMRYGYNYWKIIQAQFEESRKRPQPGIGVSQQNARRKRELKMLIRQTLSALTLLIRANNPQHWRSELWAWGFPKEKS
jgi:hypothetical protein